MPGFEGTIRPRELSMTENEKSKGQKSLLARSGGLEIEPGLEKD
jgi:hypothetical protein